MILYHATTRSKAKKYREMGYIKKPVRGFDTLMACLMWACKVGRDVIYQVEGEPCYLLPDHHNQLGKAFWVDQNISINKIKCVRLKKCK